MPHNKRRKTTCAYRATLAGILSGSKVEVLQKKLKKLGYVLSYGKSDPRQGQIVQDWGKCPYDTPPNEEEDFEGNIRLFEQEFPGCRVVVTKSVVFTLVVAEE